jgi:hypothetical protein
MYKIDGKLGMNLEAVHRREYNHDYLEMKSIILMYKNVLVRMSF